MQDCAQVDVVGVGLNATDTLIALPSYPERGSKTEYEAELVQPGGQVASATVACARWGLRARYVGKLGNDDAARLHREAFAAAGVEAQLITAPGAASPRSLILVDAGGERTVLCRRDQRVELQPGELRRDWVVHARALLVDGHDTAAAVQAAQWARLAGVPVVADLDEAYPGVEELLECVDYLVVSRGFPARLTGQGDLRRALQVLRARYGCELAAATLGEGGVLACHPGGFHHAAAFRVPVVDTTGAGDVFHAGFLLGLLEGWSLERQLDFACAAAARNCGAQGARGGIAPRAAIEALMTAGERYPAEAINAPALVRVSAGS